MNVSGLKFEAKCCEHEANLRGQLIWFLNDDKTWSPDTSEMVCPEDELIGSSEVTCVMSWVVNMVGEV